MYIVLFMHSVKYVEFLQTSFSVYIGLYVKHKAVKC